MAYSNVDAFFIVFSVANRNSFKNVLDTWDPEVSMRLPQTPKILIGTKTDLRLHQSHAVTALEGIKLAKKISASAYFELSSKNNIGIDAPFEYATKLCIYRIKKSKDNFPCLIQ